ncbi:MAG: glycoside hydrolase family 11 protein [Bacteroidales bacterium]|nr:glycoside hydrolase family 11 protein [Bacteroidales bacterium]
MRKNSLFKNVLKICLAIFSFMVCFQTANSQTITANTQSTHDGFFYSFWTENPNNGASMTLGPAGNYSTTWNNTLNFTAGKGWAVGKADRVVCFEGTYNGGSNGFLALYGWTKNPLIEYYVCEKHGQWEPPGNTGGVEYKGSYTCDGGTYKMYTGLRENKPSIIGNATFQQFWSVRTEQRSSGTITFATHVKAWETMGNMKLGTTWDYQIMESEGYNSSGSSNITMRECASSPIKVDVTAPAANASFSAPATINITATASTTAGSISKVVFYNGPTKLGEDASSPYAYSWTNVAAGTYKIIAEATDSQGNVLKSSEVTVKVIGPQTPYGGTARAIPGVIEFEHFDDGGNDNAYYDSSPGSAVTPVVNFRTTEDVDIENCTDAGTGYNLGYTVAGEWTEYTVDVKSAGLYDLDIRAACEGTGRTISITAKDKSIAANLAIPSTGGWQTWQTVSVKGIQLEAGVQIIRVTIGATDYVNLNKMTFTAQSVNVAPVLAITAPAANATITAGDKVTISATATSEKSTISKVEFFVNDALVGSDAATPYSFDWTAGAAGTYTIKVTATDAVGDKTSATVSVVVSNVVLPVVTITGPAAGAAYFVGDKVTIAANATSANSTISKIDVSVNDVVVGSDATAPYSFEWTAVAVGTQTIKVTATDANGNKSSNTVSIMVNEAPVVKSIELRKGWNLVGYPYLETMDIETALQSVWSDLLAIKDFDGSWSKDMNPALVSLRQVKYGMGYYIQVSKNCTLTWK